MSPFKGMCHGRLQKCLGHPSDVTWHFPERGTMGKHPQWHPLIQESSKFAGSTNDNDIVEMIVLEIDNSVMIFQRFIIQKIIRNNKRENNDFKY